MIFWYRVVSIGVSFGLVLVGDILPRSSADLDHGLLFSALRSPNPPCDTIGCEGEDGVRSACGRESGKAVAVRASDRSATDLRMYSEQSP